LRETKEDVDETWNEITKEIIDAKERYIPSKLVNNQQNKEKLYT